MRERRTIGFLIKQINNVYEKELNHTMKSLGITSSQCAVLDYLFHSSEEEITQREIERHLSLKNPNVTGLLKKLEEKGFPFSVPSNSDRRCKNIYLTEKAYDIQKKMEINRKKSDKMLTLGMSKREVESFEKLLEKVLYNISEP